MTRPCYRCRSRRARGTLSVRLTTVLLMRNAAFRPSFPVRVIMLAAAYAPLLLLLAVLDSFRLPWLRWAFAGLAAAGVLGTLLFLTVAIPRRNAAPEKVSTAQNHAKARRSSSSRPTWCRSS